MAMIHEASMMTLVILLLLVCSVLVETADQRESNPVLDARLPAGRELEFAGVPEMLNRESSSVKSAQFDTLDTGDVDEQVQQSYGARKLLRQSGTDQDGESLLEFKSGILDDPLGAVADWNLTGSSDYCSWNGITCNAARRVVNISLPGSQLSGTLSTSLGNLSFLSVLNLSSNVFSGSIPSGLGLCKRLVSLDLSANQLSGNQLNGAIDIPPELFQLTGLQILNLSENSLNGTVVFQSSSSLQELYLDGNQLVGGIPESVGKLGSLRILHMQGNGQLGGNIPSELGLLANLEEFDCSRCSLTGSLPYTLGSLANLTTLKLPKNNLTGSIPSELKQLSRLITLNLWNNQFSELPEEVVRGWTSLESIHMDRNNLTGTIPKAFGSLRFLKELVLERNQLTGGIPEEFAGLQQLQVLHLGNT
ncbi:hypothetical protein R1flu_016563 [Riccia fluitans]|uniref:Leucine-rich repeat-containing N-terminal plant-type domain-containing protein n=1 Tax=Riccia fluitans TaxID=41844 RepID=A0ABD1YM69_9MARC